MRRCSKCIMPDTVPGISFDDAGVCAFCQNYRPPEYLGKEALIEIIAESSSKPHGKYDCIVPLSGGRDSSFVLHLAAKEFGLNALAVNYDNEFRTDQAVKNMKRACERTDVDFLEVRSHRGMGSRMVKHNMMCSDLTRVLGVCRACTFGHRSVVFEAAERRKIPLILWGNSKQEKTKGMLVQAKKMLRKNRNRASRFFSPEYYRYEYCFLMLRLELPMPGSLLPTRSTEWNRPHIREISVFDYIPWDRNEIRDTITRELGWEKPEGSVSTWRTDCLLTTVVNYCFHRVYGCTKHCFGYCRMINDAQMTRAEALAEEEQMVSSIAEGSEMRRLLKDRIGLSEREVERILSS